jgi:hypothetical protein
VEQLRGIKSGISSLVFAETAEEAKQDWFLVIADCFTQQKAQPCGLG